MLIFTSIAAFSFLIHFNARFKQRVMKQRFDSVIAYLAFFMLVNGHDIFLCD